MQIQCFPAAGICTSHNYHQPSGNFCGTVMQAGLFTVDEKSKSKVVELKSHMAVAQQLRSSMDIRPREPIKIRRHQKLVDLIRRRSTDESRHALNLEKIAEAPETPASTACCSSERASSLADSNWVRCCLWACTPREHGMLPSHPQEF